MINRGVQGALCAGFLILLSTATEAALVSRPGGQAVYDTDLDITWLGNTNFARTNTFGLPRGTPPNTYPHAVTSIGFQGEMNWYTAQAWIDAMNMENYLGLVPGVCPCLYNLMLHGGASRDSIPICCSAKTSPTTCMALSAIGHRGRIPVRKIYTLDLVPLRILRKLFN